MATLAFTAFLWRRRCKRPTPSRSEVTVSEVIKIADRRTIIVGEHHGDRQARKVSLLLMEEAHAAGYRTLGIECSDVGHGQHPGLKAEVAGIAANLQADLTNEHKLSELDQEEDGKRPRMNRQWQIQMALRLGWEVKSIDPNYWNHLKGGADGYLHSREPQMAETIKNSKPMVVICGYSHLQALHKLLGESVVMVCATVPNLNHAPPQSFWTRRIKFAMRVPLLTA
jgi:hypothetical protein